MPKPEHYEDTYQRCGGCFEEWPCAVARGEKHVSGVQQWGQDEMMLEFLEESDERARLARVINERLAQLGIEEEGRIFECLGFSLTVTMRVETLAKLLTLIPPDVKASTEAGRTPRRASARRSEVSAKGKSR